MTNCYNCNHNKPGYRLCYANRLRLKDCNTFVRLVCNSFEMEDE